MNRRMLLSAVAAIAATAGLGLGATTAVPAETKEIVYLTPGLDLPFWRYLSKGIEAEAKKEGYSYTALDSHNSAETQLKNAQDASPAGAAVDLTVRRADGAIDFTVADRGPGMPRAVLERVGEPFFTTKPLGRGMGLGLFLARTVVERIGGSLRLDSDVGRGTTAIVRVPLPEHSE